MTFEVASLELLRSAIAHGDQDAWAGSQRCLEETVLTWLHEHPSRKVVCHGPREKHLVVQAFERFRQSAGQAQMACETLAGAILDTLRTLSRPGAVSRPVRGQAGEPGVKEQIESSKMWEVLQILLPSAREQRLAYLLVISRSRGGDVADRWGYQPQKVSRSALLSTCIRTCLLSEKQKKPASIPITSAIAPKSDDYCGRLASVIEQHNSYTKKLLGLRLANASPSLQCGR